MQVDSELDWENNSDDTGSRRSTSPCQIHAKGFSEGTLKFKLQLGISLPPEHNKPSRIDMVDKQCTSQERASDTIQAAKPRYHHLRRCIGFRLGSQFSVSTNRRLLDKKTAKIGIASQVEDTDCPVRTLKSFMDRTANIRMNPPKDHTLFLVDVEKIDQIGSVRPVTTVSWIQQVMQDAGIDTSILKSHSLREAASTWAVMHRHNIEQMKKYAN
ncbi:hypothetical protein G6F43_000014 [Rhizopus delemar]|nr:hypothetical protein G6F43_000014 [Rhizopus delemar]